MSGMDDCGAKTGEDDEEELWAADVDVEVTDTSTRGSPASRSCRRLDGESRTFTSSPTRIRPEVVSVSDEDDQMADEGGGSESGQPPTGPPEQHTEEGNAHHVEGVFEIRDFTTPTLMEKIARLLQLQLDRWAQAEVFNSSAHVKGADSLQYNERCVAPTVKIAEVISVEKIRFRITYHRAPPWCEDLVPTNHTYSNLPLGDENTSATALLRLLHNTHDFPVRCPRLQRWFGLREYFCLEALSAAGKPLAPPTHTHPSLLSALSLALTASRLTRRPYFLATGTTSCPTFTGFAMLHQPEQYSEQRSLWLNLSSSSAAVPRASLTTPYDHILGLGDYLMTRLHLSQSEVADLRATARFTYVLDCGDWPSLDDALAIHQPSLPQVPALSEVDDPIGAFHFSCTWPSAPLLQFAGNMESKDMPCRTAPRWTCRVFPNVGRHHSSQKSGLARFHRLLERSFEASMTKSVLGRLSQPPSGSTLANMGHALLEKVESVLLPSERELQDYVACIFEAPLTQAESYANERRCTYSDMLPSFWTALDILRPPASRKSAVAPVKACPPGSLFAKVAAIASDLKSFKAIALLWERVVAELRLRWERSQFISCPTDHPAASSDTVPSGTWRRPAGPVNGPSPEYCLLHQHLQILECSIAQRRISAGVDTGGPPVYPPIAESTLILAQARLSSAPDKTETLFAPLRGEVQHWRCSHPCGTAEDFIAEHSAQRCLRETNTCSPYILRIYSCTEGKFRGESEVALRANWSRWLALSAGEQTPLFDANAEAEMALHYFESLNGEELLSQLQACFLSEIASCWARSDLTQMHLTLTQAHKAFIQSVITTYAEFGETIASEGASPQPSGLDNILLWLEGNENGRPSAERILLDLEEMERAFSVATSLSLKLPQEHVLISRLMSEQESLVVSDSEREAVLSLCSCSRVAEAQKEPYAREYILRDATYFTNTEVASRQATKSTKPSCSSSHSTTPFRMYAILQEDDLRLALTQGQWLD